MIKFIAESPEGRLILGLCIVEDNVIKLKNNQPIFFRAEDMYLKEIKVNEITICYFPTYEDALNFFKKHYPSVRTIIEGNKSVN